MSQLLTDETLVPLPLAQVRADLEYIMLYHSKLDIARQLDAIQHRDTPPRLELTAKALISELLDELTEPQLRSMARNYCVPTYEGLECGAVCPGAGLTCLHDYHHCHRAPCHKGAHVFECGL